MENVTSRDFATALFSLQLMIKQTVELELAKLETNHCHRIHWRISVFTHYAQCKYQFKNWDNFLNIFSSNTGENDFMCLNYA